jgi:hypothetical protein
MEPIDVFRIITGSLIAAVVLLDVFLTIVVPRATSAPVRIAPLLYRRVLWPLMNAFTPRDADVTWKNEARGLFASAAFFCLFAVWLALLIGGFGLILLGLGKSIQPPITDFSSAMYMSGISVLTIGFGDVVPISTGARCAVVIAAVCGLLFMALLVSHLFTLQQQLLAREEVVNEMASRAGTPASGLVLLMRYRELDIMDKLNDEFNDWENWIARFLESHRAFPVLLYYPSTSARDSWLSVAGALLDAATLMTSAIRSEKRGRAELFYGLGCMAVQSMCEQMVLKKLHTQPLTREEFNEGMQLLASAGFEVADSDLAWRIFSLKREGYSPYIAALADYFDMPKQAWIHELKIAHLLEAIEEKVAVD